MQSTGINPERSGLLPEAVDYSFLQTTILKTSVAFVVAAAIISVVAYFAGAPLVVAVGVGLGASSLLLAGIKVYKHYRTGANTLENSVALSNGGESATFRKRPINLKSANLLDLLDLEEEGYTASLDRYRQVERRRTYLTKPNGDATLKLRKQTYYAVEEGVGQQPLGFMKDFDLEKLINKSLTFKNYNQWTEREVAVKVDDFEHAGTAHTQGRRTNDEDAAICTRITFTHGHEKIYARFFGVFDGHGDKGECAQLAVEKLPQRIQRKLSQADELNDTVVTNVLTQAILEVDEQWVTMGRGGGTTATCVLIINDKIYVPNVGDSRTILVKNEEEYQLSEDAKPTNVYFQRRIRKMNQYVLNKRVFGMVATARDIGIPYLSAQPKITCAVRAEKEDDQPQLGMISFQVGNYIVLACDGLWDVASTKEVGDAIRQMSASGLDESRMARILVQQAYLRGSGDNITVTVVRIS